MMSITVTFYIIILISAFGLEYLMGAEKKDFRKISWILGCFCAAGIFIWFLSLGFSFTHTNDSYGQETIRIIKTIRKEILLNDFCKILGENKTLFDDVKGEGDSLGGLLLELSLIHI